KGAPGAPRRRPWDWQSVRRPRRAIPAALGLVLVAVGLPLLLTRSGKPATPDHPRAAVVTASVLRRLDPSTGQALATVRIGGPARPIPEYPQPGYDTRFRGIAVGEGSIWVTNGLDNTVSR